MIDDNMIAFIPLRGGSKSIPLKNIKEINGRPLFYWVLDAAVQCEKINQVIVSTDDIRIIESIHKYKHPKIAIHNRSKETASDTASTESVMLEFAQYNMFKDMILIQATSPLLQCKDLEKGIEIYENEEIDSVLSVVRQKRFIWKEDEQGAKAVNYDYQNRPRRQEFEGYLVENGAFYITSRKQLLSSKCRLSGNIGLVEMDEASYFEIDEVEDWYIVEQLLKNRQSSVQKLPIKMFLTDSDGVLTDGGMYYSENGDEIKKFNTKDGMGLERLRKEGIITGIITGEEKNLIKQRATKLKVNELFMGVKDKMKVIEELCLKYNITLEEIVYVGDDINDLEVIKNVGFGVAVNDAMKEVKMVADYITKLKGGEGAVREVCDLILEKSFGF